MESLDTHKQVRLSAITHPLRAERTDAKLPEGLTIDQMLVIIQPDIRQLEHARVFVRGELIPREVWHGYKPKAGILVEVRAFPIPMGGGGDGDKNPLRTILTLAVVAAAYYFGGPLGHLVAGAFGGGATAVAIGTAVAQATITAVGLLAVNAIAPIKTPQLAQQQSRSGERDSPSYFINGARNQLRPFSPVPQVLGTYRHFPPLATKTFTEVIGEKVFLRMLVVWSIGPIDLDIDSIKIGETPITDFEGVEMEHREGYDSDQPHDLFPDTVIQDDFSILLAQSSGWQQRTSEAATDELSVDITFPQGLVQFDNKGNRTNRSVTMEIQYREVGSSPWLDIDTSDSKFKTTIPSAWLNLSGNDISSITFKHKRTSAIRHGIRWPVSSSGQYEIRERRTSADTNSTQIFDTMYWTTLRSISIGSPISMPIPVASTALVVQSTDQLNNQIDELNAEITTVCLDWDSVGETWTERATNNPASLFRHVLQGNAKRNPIADSEIDLTTLQDWHEFCEARGFTYNMMRDFKASIWATLQDVALAGRAAATQIDGKWSVIVDQPQSDPASYITPRNSWDFKAQKYFVDLPHGWRVPFANEEQGYRFDERRVYRDGYNDSNATKFEELELPGVTNADQVYQLGRYRIAQGLLHPERWVLRQDLDYITYQRGSRIAITHDVLQVGLAFGRVKSVTVDGSNNVTHLHLDEFVTMEAGKDYGVAIRTINDALLTGSVVTVAETTKDLQLTTPIPGIGSPAVAAVAAGDLCGFGLLGAETDDASVIAIIPDTEFRAQVVMVPYREAVYDADSETIPTFETNLTPLTAIPMPVITSVVSDESVLVLGPGESLRTRIAVTFEPLGTELFGVEPELRVQMRPSDTGEPFTNAEIDLVGPGHVFITGVLANEQWDIRIRFVVGNRLPGPWTYEYNHTVVGKSTPPAALSGMTISAFGSSALIRWNKPDEIDVLFGGEVVFRHSPALTGATWGGSTTIGNAARARTLSHVLPLKEGTYLARVFDVAGVASEEITTVTTKQVHLSGFSTLDSLAEEPSFLGTKTDCKVSSSQLEIDDTVSPKVLTAMYEFSSGIDLTTVERVRITTQLEVNISLISDLIDSRTELIDTWEDFDGTLEAGGDAYIEVRHTDDDPAGSPVSWSEWEKLEAAEFEARGFEFRLTLVRDSEEYNVQVSDLGVVVEQLT